MNEEIVNPIDEDKVSDAPGLLEYAHHVGSALIRPVDRGKLKGRSLAAMYEQTDLQMQQIRRQIELLAEEAKKIEQRGGVAAAVTQVDIRDEDAADPMTRCVGGAHAREDCAPSMTTG